MSFKFFLKLLVVAVLGWQVAVCADLADEKERLNSASIPIVNVDRGDGTPMSTTSDDCIGDQCDPCDGGVLDFHSNVFEEPRLPDEESGLPDSAYSTPHKPKQSYRRSLSEGSPPRNELPDILRNMSEAGANPEKIFNALLSHQQEKILKLYGTLATATRNFLYWRQLLIIGECA